MKLKMESTIIESTQIIINRMKIKIQVNWSQIIIDIQTKIPYSLNRNFKKQNTKNNNIRMKNNPSRIPKL